MTAMQEEAVRLYREGLDLRQVGAEVGRSHEWVRLTLREAGEPLRERGRVPKERPECIACHKPAASLTGSFCSFECRKTFQGGNLRKRLTEAMRLVNQGATYEQAAVAVGFGDKWLLWGKLYEYGYLTSRHVQTPLVPKI